MDLNFFFNRFLKLSQQTLNEKDHRLVTTLARQLQEDLALRLKSLDVYDKPICIEEFIASTLNYGGKDVKTSN